MRRAARVDTNQLDIVFALRKIGASVQHLHTVGRGCPDLLVGYRGVNVLMEVKKNLRSPMTDDELAWHLDWNGQVAVVFDPESAVNVLQKVCAKNKTLKH